MGNEDQDRDWVATGGLNRLDRRTHSEGWIRFPAVPLLLDFYVRRIVLMFAAMGKKFDKDEIVTLRNLIEPRMRSGWAQSSHAKMMVSWVPEPYPATGIEYTVAVETSTTASHYASWVDRDEPPFGPHPDSRAVHLAADYTPPYQSPILDIGAGVGRNALPLARLGYPVTALDLTPEFCAALEAAANTESLAVGVVCGNVIAEEAPQLPASHYAMVLASEVTSHFRGPQELRLFFERTTGWLRPGGTLLLNAFLGDVGFEPPPWLRQAAEVHWSWFLLRSELVTCIEGLPLVLEAEHVLYDYEKQHYPGEWPPTAWYHDWSRGYDIVKVPDEGDHQPPFRMVWLTFRRT